MEQVFFIGIKGDRLEVEVGGHGKVLLKKETWSKRNRAGQVVGSCTEYPLSFFYTHHNIAIPASKETACFPSLSNTALRSLKSYRSRIPVMKTCFLKTLSYFVLKEEIFTFKFRQFELRLVNENNVDKSAFASGSGPRVLMSTRARDCQAGSLTYLSNVWVRRSSDRGSVDVFSREVCRDSAFVDSARKTSILCSWQCSNFLEIMPELCYFL